MPDHLLVPSTNAGVEIIRMRLLEHLQISLPMFDPVEELMNAITLSWKKIFFTQCHMYRRKYSQAYAELCLPVKVYDFLFRPYLIVSGLKYTNGKFQASAVVVKLIIEFECAFGSSNYQINFLNPLVKPIFMNDEDLFDIQVSSQRLNGIIARNMMKETKNL